MKKGFTLIETMVVVAVVIILITLAVPSILRSRVVANEGAAVANLKTLCSASQAYHIDNQAYPADLAALASANPPYIDNVLGTGRKQGYQFIYATVDSDHFTVNANSVNTGLLKGRYFYMDESGTIRVKGDAPAGPSDDILG